MNRNMNSALKPVLSTSGPQNSSGSTQINKPMHQQSGTTTSYGQPPSHMQPSLVNLPHNQNSGQQNHYSLNVPSAPQHYMSSNTGTIPISNHPVTNVSQTTTQIYNPPKNSNYSSGYQANLGHTNQNTLPPVSQSLPPSTPVAQPTQQNNLETVKPQSNGTSDQNYVQVKEKPSTTPAVPPAVVNVVEKSPEKPKTPQTEQKPTVEAAKVAEETNVTTSEASGTVGTAGTTVEPTEKDEEREKQEEKPNESAEIAEEVKNSAEQPTESETAQNSEASTKNKDSTKTPSPAKVTTPRQTSPRKSKTPKSDGETTPKTTLKESKVQQFAQKSPTSGKIKRQRTRTQPYQSPLPEMEIISKITSSTPRNKNTDEKLIVFYKNEFLAVRNLEGSFYVCQAVQNIYKSSLKIKIRWLSQDKTDKTGEIYTPDFYDTTDFDCILTNLNLDRVDKGKYRLPPDEKERTDSILKRSLAVEKGEVTSPSLTEGHPDGLDLSLYTEESQLNKRKRRAGSALRPGRKPKSTTKSPEQPKVRKTVTKTVKKGRKTIAGQQKKAQTSNFETKTATTTTSRAGRAKKRNENTKSSPVVDQKKAKVLAKVARKTAVKQQSVKLTKSATVPSTSKAKETTKMVGTRKVKRATRK